MDNIVNKNKFRGTTAKTLSFRDYQRLRLNDIGNPVLENIDIYISGAKTTVEISDAFIKIVDEIITNCCDQYMRESTCKTIDISVKPDGSIIVKNNGPGFPIYKEEKSKYTDRPTYSIETMLSAQFSSTNYTDKSKPDSISAGLNGLGIKLTNICSLWFEIKTINNGVLYTQRFENGMKTIKPPSIKNTKRSNGTIIKFMPDYDHICRRKKSQLNTGWFKSADQVIPAVHKRAIEIMVYLNALEYHTESDRRITFRKTPKIKFCGKQIPNMTLAEWAQSFDFGTVIKCNISGRKIPRPFKFAIAIYRNPHRKKFAHFSIVNGVITVEEGNYLTELIKQIAAYIKPKFIAKFNQDFSQTVHLRNLIAMWSIALVPKSMLNFKGQFKSKVTLALDDKKTWNNWYKVPSSTLAEIWLHLEPVLAKIVTRKKQRVKRVDAGLYIPATKCKQKNAKCTLFVVEGNSAATLIQDIIKANPKLSTALYGIYSVQGVPINALRNTKYINGQPIMNKRLINNKALQALAQIIGLDYNATYENPKSLRTLHYSSIIISTDQDTDGIGKICSLIICFIYTYWANLIKHGFISRYRTPIVRVYCHRKPITVHGFYSEAAYDTFYLKHTATCTAKHDVKYYKGLGTHTKAERKHMAKTFPHDIVTYYDTDKSYDMMVKMHGSDTAFRKLILRNQTIDKYRDEKHVSIAEHYAIASKEQQLDNIRRMIPEIGDGFNPVHRKVFATLRGWRHSQVNKVFQLGGETAKKKKYAHGDASINGAIMGLAQAVPGLNHVPIICPISGSIGSQIHGRKGNAQPRYTDVGYNICTDYLFPKADDAVLEYTEVEGEICEPKFYVSVLPRILFEHLQTVATGWSYKIWGREIDKLAVYTKISIRGYPKTIFPNLIGAAWMWDGMTTRIINGCEYCFGEYALENDTLHITQLPVQCWSHGYHMFLQGLDSAGKPLAKNRFENVIKSIEHNNDSTSVYFKIKLHNGWETHVNSIKTPNGIDPLVKYFKLYTKLPEILNFLKCGVVTEYKQRGDIWRDWFSMRRELYIARINYQSILLQAKIDMWQNIITFIGSNTGQYKGMNRADRHKAWTAAKYLALNRAAINNPGNCTPTQLRVKIYKTNCSFNYIDDIRESWYSTEEQRKIRERICKLAAELAELSKGWQTIWITEIDQLMEKVSEGIQTDWTYNKVKVEFK